MVKEIEKEKNFMKIPPPKKMNFLVWGVKKIEYGSVLEFEGEYINDKKWSGKGKDPFNNIVYELKEGKGLIKEYYCYIPKDSKLLFEGEDLYGKKNWKGREYYDNDNGTGKIQFESEYINEQRNGKGKEYYRSGKLRYEDEYLYTVNVFRVSSKFFREFLETRIRTT